MKKIVVLTVVSLLIFMAGCSSDEKNNIYGEYVFEEVSYVAPLSSMSKDGIKDSMKGSKYSIQEDLFTVQSSELQIEVVSPKYVKEEIDMDSLTIFETDFFKMNNIKLQYSIYDKDGNQTRSLLFASPDDLWIATNTNVTPDGQLIIFSIIRLSK